MEDVVGFTEKQRKWFLERDNHQCQMFRYVRGKWVQCPNKTKLQVHHLIPRGWCKEHLPKTFPLNGSQNGICLCTSCHVGLLGVHPDTQKAKVAYRNGDKNAFTTMRVEREKLNSQGIPYWNTQWDWLFQRRIKKNNLKMLRRKPYPQNGNRDLNGRIRG